MAKRATTALGLVLVAVGLVGFAAPALLGAHLSVAHNLVHIATGALSLAFGIKGTREGARVFCLVFGGVYGLLGLLGLLLGQPGTAEGHAASDDRLWRAVPGVLELGTVDHLVHGAVGIAFVAAGLATKIVRAPLERGAATR